MANVYRCDNCGKEEPAYSPGSYSSTPPTWIDITERLPGHLPTEYHHVCSRACGAAFLSKAREEAAPVPEAPIEPELLRTLDNDIPF